MNVREILTDVKAGMLSIEEAAAKIQESQDNYVDLGFSKVDIEREARTGFPEVIFGQGKTPEVVAEIFSKLVSVHRRALATRVSEESAMAILARVKNAIYNATARTVHFGDAKRQFPGIVAVVSAGTSDLPVAEEAAITAQWMGCQVDRVNDVGVAGIHRLLAQSERIQQADVVIVVAGMEGALPSVVGGLVRRPVIAVPTSIGYGAHLQGLTPLLAMLSSCAAGITVVNIDNGFGAGYAAAVIQQLVWEAINC